MFIPGDGQAGPANIGKVFEVKAGAFGTPPGGATASKRLDDGVVLDEFIETVPDGALQLSLLDNTVVSMGGGSKLVLDELVFDKDSLTGSSVIRFTSGTFFWVTGQIATKERMLIETPGATIGIRGTEFSLKIGADGATQVAVVEGLVDLRSKTTGEVVSIPAGHNADVNGAGRVSTLRVGVPRTGDRNVDMVVAKAEEKVIQAAAKAADKAADKGAKADDKAAKAEDKEARSGSVGRVLPVKADILKTEAANDNGKGVGNGPKLDNSRPITVSTPNASGDFKVASGNGGGLAKLNPETGPAAAVNGNSNRNLDKLKAITAKVSNAGGNGGGNGNGNGNGTCNGKGKGNNC